MTHLTADHRPADKQRVYRLISAWATGDADAATLVIAEALVDEPADMTVGLARLVYALTECNVDIIRATGTDPADLARAALLDMEANG